MVMDGKDNGMGGRHPTGIGDVFQGGGAGGTLIWFMDVGDDPLHLQGPGEFSAKSFQADYGETAEVTGGQDLGVHTSGDIGVGGRVQDMGAYVLKMQNTVAQYIAARMILELYDDMVWRSGGWLARRWWQKDGMDLAVARTVVEVVEDG